MFQLTKEEFDNLFFQIGTSSWGGKSCSELAIQIYCYAVLNDYNLFESLLVANAVSGSYVKTGISPDVSNLIEFLKHFQD